MYYIVYGLLYLLSLLPFWVLYRMSDFCRFLVFGLLGYRKTVVKENIRNAFPEKSEAERQEIARRFYGNFCDTWFEMLKLLSASRQSLLKRVDVQADLMFELYKTGKSVQGFTGHFMNWEYTTVSLPGNQPYLMLGVYMPVGSRIFERLLVHLRSRFGCVLLKAGRVKRDMLPYENTQYMMGLAADQSPAIPTQASWLYFMNQPAGFIRKPWQKSVELNQPAVYLKVDRLKRGHFRFRFVELVPDPAKEDIKDMILRYRDLLETDIRNNPDNYLWTHRRWKKKWQESYKDLWIDPAAPPAHPE